MAKENIGEEEFQTVAAHRPGDVLKRAREASGMSLADVAEVTRIAIRQLEALERNDFAALPGTPYAVGFSRAYARAVNADEVAIASAVRAELGASEPGSHYEMFEPVDPARIPPRWLAIAAALLAVLLAIAYGVWRSQVNSPLTDAELTAKAEQAASVTSSISQPAPAQKPAPTVVLTALSDVWLRVYDQSGERLLERDLKQGESYAVPASAQNPMIMTGRPEALQVTVDGQQVAPLGPPSKAISDMPISAAALLARTSAAPAETVTKPVAPAAAPAVSRPASPAPASAPESRPQATPKPAASQPSTQPHQDEAHTPAAAAAPPASEP